MTSAYQYTPDIWPLLATTAFMAALGLYSWRRRSVPGAKPFAIACLFAVLWLAGAVAESAAVDVSAKIAWYNFQTVCALPTVTAMTCFALEYAGAGRWLSRRNVILLSIPPLLSLLLVLTNDLHHLSSLGFAYNGAVQPLRGTGGWILLVYGWSLVLVNITVFVWLFIRSPQHRWPVALMIFGQAAGRGLYLLEIANLHSVAPVDPFVLAAWFPFAMYAIALFGFRIFDPLPAARQTVIEQMREGMVVFDSRWQVLSLNPAAEIMLCTPAARARGNALQEILPAFPDLSARLAGAGADSLEISLATGPEARYYAPDLSQLRDHRGLIIGYLLLLRDITEQHRAQAQILEQQRVVATLEERQRLARELHDSVGQMLGYVSMQAQAIRKWVHDGETATAEAQLTHLAAAAQEAHADLRESILGLMVGSAHEWSLLTALRQYLDAFRDHHGIRIELIIPSGLEDQVFAPDTSVQLLRVIQEALNNARRHGRARCVQVAFEREDSQARIIVADDGCGFDPGQLSAGEGDHLGLAFMRERMAQIGGQVTVHSRRGAGTRVVFQVPIREE